MGRALVAVGVAASACLFTAGAARADTGAALPLSADAPIEVIEPNAGMSIRVRLLDAAPAAALPASGDAVYPRAIGDADLVRRALDDGVEDFVRYPTRPEHEAVTYSVDLQKVAGVRLVSNTVEFLDAEGVPRLRMAPPSITDANGVEHEATVGVDGCSYSADPRIPWKRPVTPPESASCAVRVQWSIQSYPAELDPVWTTTGSMALGRSDFAMVVVPDGILALGGITDIEKGTVTEQAEFFYPLQTTGAPAPGAWISAGAMNQARTHFEGVVLPDGTVLIAGGCSDARHCKEAPATSVEVFHATNHTSDTMQGVTLAPHEWSLAKAVIDPDGIEKVLVLGGTSSVADVYDTKHKTWDKPESVPWQAQGLFEFTATTFQDPRAPDTTGLLVCGGTDSSGTPQSKCYVRRQGNWNMPSTANPFVMSHARFGHTSNEMRNGSILLVGGDAGGSVDRWTPTKMGMDHKFTQMPPLTFPRRYHAAARRSGGVLIVTGGEQDDASTVTSSAEGFTEGSPSWFSRDYMHVPRAHHSIARLTPLEDPATTDNQPLLVAGGRATKPLRSAELVAPLLDGSDCTADSDCEGRHCKRHSLKDPHGVCCSCQTCYDCTEDGGCAPADAGSFDERCAETNTTHACAKRHRCDEHGVCRIDNCKLRACIDGECADAACGGELDCAPGAECRETDAGPRCLCKTNAACPGETCKADGRCGDRFSGSDPQVSCELSEPVAGVGAWMLVCAAGLAARRRLQSGKLAKTCGNQRMKGP